MKQTAVEWLIEQMNNIKGSSIIMNGRVQFIEKELNNLLDQAKAMEKEQSIHKLFVGFQEWHKNEYGSKYVEIDQFNEYLETFKSE